ncbi:exonuclease subunit SbcD [Gillisia hiemivivida]|uniref:Nuclease SbcCD subunit D n=1 Tax=Gillisia hiemivivida TaxID=291190 RepID=A0A5C6ZU71_9FLAO|nr:exonuclease subunit SbcD [Gillisia hiemivivida]TXD94369.1 exonuclease subunit SbcD [Gillisia hiemivivida]
MKILHTADWHIGKKLHKHDLYPDFDLFINWLCNCIQENDIELLLISGDVFDLANPSSDARKQYYKALLKLRNLDCKIILTGGNHDSPAMLDAPGEILRELEMHVVGSLRENIEECIIPIKGKSGETEIVVAALPYLRDADLRSAADGNTYEDRLEAIRMGIQNTFFCAAEICKTKYPNIPALAMGHLYAAGVETSESERDIQIGNQAAFQASQFGDFFNYIALGHIHKPQKVNGLVPTYYSGSPIPLSFSERKDEKRVLILDSGKSWIPESIPVPIFRKLLKISGDLNELQTKLSQLINNSSLNNLIELEMIEEQYDATKLYELDKLIQNFNSPGFEIVKSRVNFKNKLSGASELYAGRPQLEDLKPREVFLELLAKKPYETDISKEILGAFDELMEDLQQQETPNEL